MSHSSLRVEKDLTHSYLYLYGKVWKEDSHEQKIIQQCSIPGTLPFRLIQEEQEDIFQYNFSPYERMLDYFSDKKMNLSHILSLFESIRFALFHLEEFLLSPEVLGLDIEEIIYDAENSSFLFPLIPSEKNALEDELKKLIDYVFNHVDEEDDCAILSAYFLQQERKKEHLQLPRILQILHCTVDKEGRLGAPFSSSPDVKAISSEKLPFGKRVSKEIEKTPADSENKTDSKSEKNPDSNKSLSVQELDLSSCSYSEYMGKQQEKVECSTPFSVASDLTPSFSEENEKRDISCFASDTRYEKKEKWIPPHFSSLKQVLRNKKKILLCLLIMILFPIILYAWKGKTTLIEVLPCIILIEVAILLYGILDFLPVFFSSEKEKSKSLSNKKML